MLKTIEKTKDGVGTLIEQTRDAVIGATGRAERGVESAADAVVRKTYATGERVREGAASAANGALRGTENAAQALDHGVERAQRDLSRLSTATSEYVASNPGKALLLTASAGFLLGYLLRPRQS